MTEQLDDGSVTLKLIRESGPVRLDSFIDMLVGWRRIMHATENEIRVERGAKRLRKFREYEIVELELPGHIRLRPVFDAR